MTWWYHWHCSAKNARGDFVHQPTFIKTRADCRRLLPVKKADESRPTTRDSPFSRAKDSKAFSSEIAKRETKFIYKNYASCDLSVCLYFMFHAIARATTVTDDGQCRIKCEFLRIIFVLHFPVHLVQTLTYWKAQRTSCIINIFKNYRVTVFLFK